MRPLADRKTQVFNQQLFRVRRFVGKVVNDEGGVHWACMDVEVTVDGIEGIKTEVTS